MTQVMAVLVVVLLVLVNGGWAWLRTKFPALPASPIPDSNTNIIKSVSATLLVGEPLITKSPVLTDTTEGIHSLVDHWLAIRGLPQVVADPASVAALEVIRAKILETPKDTTVIGVAK